MDVTVIPSSERLLDRRAAARDCWPGGTLAFWQGEGAPLPARVWWPESEEQVLALLVDAADRGVPVVPYGSGSGVCGGARGREGAWTLDTKRLDGIGEVDAESLSIRVEAGVNGQQLEDHLQSLGYTLGHSPSSISCSTVGGWAAARSAGQFSSRYGVFEDMVLGLTLVTPAGIRRCGVEAEPAEVDSALLPLALGSEGTLGIITSVTVRVWPAPATRTLRGYRFRDIDSALEAMRLLMQGELWPSVVRLYDPVDTRIGGKTKVRRAESPARNQAFYRRWLRAVADLDPIRKRSLAIPLALPGVLNQIFDRLAHGVLLIVGWEGNPEVVEAASAAGHRILEVDGEDLGEAPGKRWYDSRHAVSYKLMPVFERGGFADTMEVAARWSVLADTYEAVRAALRPHAVVLAHMSHVYPEGGSIYFSFAGQGDRETYERVWRAALDAVLASGATVSHHHGIGSLKAPWASREIGPAVAGWTETKRQLDPTGVLNPGRLFVSVPPTDAPAVSPLDRRDGLVRVDVDGTLADRQAAAEVAGAELMFPWERLPAPARWARNPWQTGWSEVSGRVGAGSVLLGRGPRSAVGPDMREWVVSQSTCRCTVPVVPMGARWMGTARCRNPWKVALELLRNDLRPSVLDVVDGALWVGFRGPAADAYGMLADRWTPGGLQTTDYREMPLVSGPMVRVPIDSRDVAAVTLQGAWSRA